MKELSLEQREHNLQLLVEKLQKFVSNDVLEITESLKINLRDAPFAMNADTNMAYDGGLIDIVLRNLTPLALKVNELLKEKAQADKDSLIKVCLCHHLAKATMFEKNTNQWEIEKRGNLYKFTPSSDSLKLGMRSLMLAQSLGITFTNEEAEAMTILDREPDDEQARFHSNPISYIVKITNELIYVNNKFGNED